MIRPILVLVALSALIGCVDGRSQKIGSYTFLQTQSPDPNSPSDVRSLDSKEEIEGSICFLARCPEATLCLTSTDASTPTDIPRCAEGKVHPAN